MLNQIKSLLTTAFVLSFVAPAKALEVNISPVAPQQGDTISVTITTDDPDSIPTLNLNQKTYPVLPIDNGYRAFVPTSPLDTPGKLTIQVTGDETTKNYLILWFAFQHHYKQLNSLINQHFYL